MFFPIQKLRKKKALVNTDSSVTSLNVSGGVSKQCLRFYNALLNVHARCQWVKINKTSCQVHPQTLSVSHLSSFCEAVAAGRQFLRGSEGILEKRKEPLCELAEGFFLKTILAQKFKREFPQKSQSRIIIYTTTKKKKS